MLGKSKTEILCENQMNAWKLHFSSAHFDTSFIAMRCWLAESWVIEWLNVDLRKLWSLPFNFNIVFCNACASIRLNLDWIGAFATFKINLNPIKYPNSAKQHRRAIEKVSKCTKENCAFYECIPFSHNISVFDISDNL